MKAVVYKGPNDVSVEDVPDAKIEHPADVLVRITSTNICGSDLHMYEGRTSFEPGRTFGHENLGEVVEAGPAVSKVKVGDRVVLPFNIACGFCKNCERGLHQLLPDHAARAQARRRSLRVRGHGPVPGRTGRIPARAVRGLQLPAPGRGLRGERTRLRHGRGHLPHRLARHRAGRRLSGRLRRHLRCRTRRAHGRLLGHHQRRRKSHGRGPPQRPAEARGTNRCHPCQ